MDVENSTQDQDIRSNGVSEETDTIKDDFDFFTFDPDDQKHQEEVDLSMFDGIEPETVREAAPSGQPSEKREESEKEDVAMDRKVLNFEDSEKKEDGPDPDLEALNKKLGKDYKSMDDLKKELEGASKKEEEVSDEKQLEEIESSLSLYEPIMRLSDEDLMRKQYETVAVQKGQDLNDEDVRLEIEEKVQNLIDSHTLYLTAKDLRNTLNEKVLSPLVNKKKEIVANREKREMEQKQKTKEELQNAFSEIFHSNSFFGIKPTQEQIIEIYKNVESGKFLDDLTKDKKGQAKLATLLKFEEEIFKKASGLSYSDGMKAVLDEFKSKQESKSLSRTQSMGGSAGIERSEGLINDLLKDSPVENRKPRV